MAYASAKNIPLSRRFSTRMAETVETWIGEDACKLMPLSGTSFSRLRKEDKLFVFGHGSRVGIAWMMNSHDWQDNAGQLAVFLREHGLREVGLITFKACNVGIGPFLSTFARTLEQEGIKAGWLKGYKGFDDTLMSDDGTVHDMITKDRDQKIILKGDERVRIVKGPGGLFEGQNFGRYRSA